MLLAALLAAGANLHAQGTGLVVTSSNNVGIGTSTPAALLELSNVNNPTAATSYDPGSGVPSTLYVANLKSSSEVTSLSGVTAANFDYFLVNPSATTSQQITGRQFITTIPASNSTSFSSSVSGTSESLYNYGSGYSGILAGEVYQVKNFGAGNTVNDMWGISMSVGNGNNASQHSTVNTAIGSEMLMTNGTANGLITNRYGIYAAQSNVGTVTNDYGLYVIASNLGTVTNEYGLYLTGLTTGTHTNVPYDIYAADSGANNYFAGNVGIGTTNPQAKLHISSGTGLISGNSDNTYPTGFYFSGNSGLNRQLRFTQPSLTQFSIQATDSSGNPMTDSPLFLQPAGGNVGIGTTSPIYKLDVAGSVHATSFVSSTTTYADFVFKPGYKLASLNEVEASIKKEGHLPGIPSAEEAQAQGIDLAQMQVKLLQKIEELTLHQIEQEKLLQDQATRLDQQSQRIDQLEQENTVLRTETSQK